MITQKSIEKILSMTRIEEVIGDFVPLRKEGANYKGCCPFHDEKTPSFVVSPAKGIFKCFGCGKAGNAITFLKEKEHFSYVEAIKYLGNKYHVEIVETWQTAEGKGKRELCESLQAVNNFAAEWFENALWETDEGKSVGLAYCKKRGFSEETIRKYRLGYCPQAGDAFTKAAESKGYKLDYLQKTGLTSVSDNGKTDKFRGRIIFPIMSLSGNVVGFGGRTKTSVNESGLGEAKYVNSPNSEIYDKSFVLYGLSLAKNEIVKKDECILVESYTDVLSLYQTGIQNVVASLGTALTQGQIRLIKRFTKNIVVMYDGDAAGIKAAIRVIDNCLENDMNVRLVLLPDGADPDTFVSKQMTDEDVAKYILEHKTDFLSFRIRLAENEIGNDPVARGQFLNEMALTISKIPNEINRMVFIQECCKRLGIEEQVIKNQVMRNVEKRGKE